MPHSSPSLAPPLLAPHATLMSFKGRRAMTPTPAGSTTSHRLVNTKTESPISSLPSLTTTVSSCSIERHHDATLEKRRRSIRLRCHAVHGGPAPLLGPRAMHLVHTFSYAETNHKFQEITRLSFEPLVLIRNQIPATTLHLGP
jgi:hypothetical protein